MRVPDEFAKVPDAEVIVRVQTDATGKVECAKKLSTLPPAVPAKADE